MSKVNRVILNWGSGTAGVFKRTLVQFPAKFQKWETQESL